MTGTTKVAPAGVAAGLVGLGRMGASMTRRLARAGIAVVGYDVSPVARAALADEPRVSLATNLTINVERIISGAAGQVRRRGPPHPEQALWRCRR